MSEPETVPPEQQECLHRTSSVCPVCLQVLPAQVVAEGRQVSLLKECPEHGPYKVPVWPDRDHYQWIRRFRLPELAPEHTVASQRGCPDDCGLCGSHRRRPTLVEIELTEKCNLRCPVCFMAAEEVQATAAPGPDLSELATVFSSILKQTGPGTSIQLTGGEPTMRPDLTKIVELGRQTGFAAIEVNTNGVVLGRNPEYAKTLAAAGVSGIYLQFDGLTRQVYETIRGADLLGTKLKALQHCRDAGIQVVLAMTVISGVNQHQMGDLLRFALINRDVVAGVAYQPAFGSGRFDLSHAVRLNMGDVAFMLAEQSDGLLSPYDLWPLGCSHPLCSAATYLMEDERGGFTPLTRQITPDEYLQLFDPASPQGSVFPDLAEKLAPDSGQAGLSVVVMNYMDAFTMDLERLQECSMTVYQQGGRIVPFCSYQLTTSDGQKRPQQGAER